MTYSVRRNAHKRDFPRLKGCGYIIIYLRAINAGNAISAGINAKRKGAHPCDPFPKHSYYETKTAAD